MERRCFEIDEHGRVRSADVAQAVAIQRAQRGTAWIDVESPSPVEVEEILRGFGLDAELIGQFVELGHAARTVVFDGGVFFEVPLEIAGQPAEIKSAVFVCLDHVLVTFRGGLDGAASWIQPEEALKLEVRDPSPVTLASVLLIELSVALRRNSLDVRRTIADLADRLDREPTAVAMDEILQVKRRLYDLDAVGEEREAAIESLQAVDRFARNSSASEQLVLVLGNTAATTRRLDRLDRRAEALQARVGSAEQEKTNRRLSRLTIISAVFLPLTLIAGIYGMNFEVMPELRYPLAYPLTLAGMVVITLALLWWFRRSGWME
jgi:Mg2+ and Co2+ transporter CorA